MHWQGILCTPCAEKDTERNMIIKQYTGRKVSVARKCIAMLNAYVHEVKCAHP